MISLLEAPPSSLGECQGGIDQAQPETAHRDRAAGSYGFEREPLIDREYRRDQRDSMIE
jgi:hypothetical protein